MSPATIRALRFDPERAHPAWMVLEALPVPPPNIRPSREHSEGDGTRGQDDLSLKLKRIASHALKLEALEQEEKEEAEKKKNQQQGKRTETRQKKEREEREQEVSK